jgi:hypothetical protein
MEKVQEYRKRAAECQRLASAANNQELRTVYTELAQVWAKMAGERIELLIPHHEQDAYAKDSDRPKSN